MKCIGEGHSYTGKYLGEDPSDTLFQMRSWPADLKVSIAYLLGCFLPLENFYCC